MADLAASFVVGTFGDKYKNKKWTRVHSLQQRHAPRDTVPKLVNELAELRAEMS